MRITKYENNATLLFHLNDVSVIQIIDLPMRPIWEIPTDVLRGENRQLGSHFRIRWQGLLPEPSDSLVELRAASSEWIVVLGGQ